MLDELCLRCQLAPKFLPIDTKGDGLNPYTPRELLVASLLLNRVELVLRHLYERSSGHDCLGLSPSVFSGRLWLGRAHSAQ